MRHTLLLSLGHELELRPRGAECGVPMASVQRVRAKYRWLPGGVFLTAPSHGFPTGILSPLVYHAPSVTFGASLSDGGGHMHLPVSISPGWGRLGCHPSTSLCWALWARMGGALSWEGVSRVRQRPQCCPGLYWPLSSSFVALWLQ